MDERLFQATGSSGTSPPSFPRAAHPPLRRGEVVERWPPASSSASHRQCRRRDAATAAVAAAALAPRSDSEKPVVVVSERNEHRECPDAREFPNRSVA